MGKPMPPDPSRSHILTVCLEDYSHVGTVQGVVRPHHWHRLENRVMRNTLATLDLLDSFGAKATFFCLGWIGEHQPECIREVVRRGHEVASKGYWHRPIRSMTPDEFREDALRSRHFLERAAGTRVIGYRVAQDWISPRAPWALAALRDCGYTYDSSYCPLGVPLGGYKPSQYCLHQPFPGEDFWEVPISSLRLGVCGVPIGGGNYVRQFPAVLMRRAVARWIAANAHPLVFYFHIWELDPQQPRITAAPKLQRLRQYRNLHSMPEKIADYLSRYTFTSISRFLDLEIAPLAAATENDRAWEAAAGVRLPADPEQARMPITLVVPCYNEEAALPTLANALQRFEEKLKHRYCFSLVIVDDGSQDRTWELLNSLFGGASNVRLVRHPSNRGVAETVLTGVSHSSTEIACVIDCDLTYDLENLEDMIPMLAEGVDVVTASPYHPQGHVLNVPGWRLLLSRGLSWLYRRLLQHKLMTYTSCFRVYRRSILTDLSVRNSGFVGIAEILVAVERRGGRIVECPASLEARLLGQSKMKVVRTVFSHLRLISEIVSSYSRDVVPQATSKGAKVQL